MRNTKTNPNIRAIKLWHSLCPNFFPIMIANQLFANLSPYFNIYMSAEIVNEIIDIKNTHTIIRLVLITIFGNFLISVLGGALKRAYNHQTTLLDQKESALFNNKVLTLDYDNLENTKVRQLRRKIIESAKINDQGKKLLLSSVNDLAYNVINIIFAAYLFSEMMVLIVRMKLSLTAVLLVCLIVMLIALNVWISFFTRKKMSKIWNDVSQFMIEENRVGEAMDCYNMGKDVRLYRQDKLIMKINEYALGLHKKAFKKSYGKQFNLEIPMNVFQYALQASVYILVCMYALKGAFGIGSIIKYLGYIQRLINSIITLFDLSGSIKYNTPFIEDYLAFLDTPSQMRYGRLPVKKADGGEYEIEFKNVSFKYPSSDTYALRNISIKLKKGERNADLA